MPISKHKDRLLFYPELSQMKQPRGVRNSVPNCQQKPCSITRKSMDRILVLYLMLGPKLMKTTRTNKQGNLKTYLTQLWKRLMRDSSISKTLALVILSKLKKESRVRSVIALASFSALRRFK